MCNENLRELARIYNQAHDLPAPQPHNVAVVPDTGKVIASLYARLPANDTSGYTRHCYAELEKEVWQQFYFLLNAGYLLCPWRCSGQPYQSSIHMRRDVRKNKVLFFFTGGEAHPALSKVDFVTGLSTNDVFRAIHDTFGHCAEGYSFSPDGEHNAWLHHSQMFSIPAQRALTTETRGQNSWVNFGPFSHLPARTRPFADQKCALLPDHYSNWRLYL